MRIKFITLGCKVNQYETQALRESFLSEGHEVVTEAADVCIVNTCTVTSRADSKSREMIVRARRENPHAKIAVTGCLTQLNKVQIASLNVDFVVPQNEKTNLVDIVLNKPLRSRDIWAKGVTDFPNQRAFVKIQDGCNNRCSFCKVPLVRGNSVSRPQEAVLDEVQKLSYAHKEIVLCGINIGLYGKDLSPALTLSQLIEKIVSMPGIGRLRLSSLEPYSVDSRIIEWLAHPKICAHAHFPFQSGDDLVLKLMNKKETVSMYESVVHRIRRVNPLCAISCDIIVGIPGEDDVSFARTLEFLKKVKPMRMHVFPFSPREGTRFELELRDNTAKIAKRVKALKMLAAKCTLAYKKDYLGRCVHMVSEEFTGGYTLGYTEHYVRVALKGKAPLGELLPVKVGKIVSGKVVVTLRES